MATFTIGATQLRANVEADAAPHTLTASVNSVSVQLNDTNGQWGNVVDQTRHIKQWGAQNSKDGGVTWQWGPVWQGDTNDVSTWIPFGTVGKNGLPPFLAIGSNSLVGLAGNQLRLACITDADVILGATIIAQ